MKPSTRKLITRIAVGVILFALILFVPIPIGQMKDGGTKVYRAVTYKIVVWNALYDETVDNGDGTYTVAFQGVFHKTSVYWFSDASKTDEELWAEEKAMPDFRNHLVEG